MTLREKAIKQLSKSIPIEPNKYTESRIQKLIKLWRRKKRNSVKYTWQPCQTALDAVEELHS